MRLLLILPLIVLTGCASMDPPKAFYDAQLARSISMIELAKQPMVTITCTSGCSASVLDPRAMQNVGKIEEGTTTGKVVSKVSGDIKSIAKVAVPVMAGADLLESAIKNAGPKTFTAGGNINNDTPSTTISNSSVDGTQDNSVVSRDGDEHVGDKNIDSGNTDNSVNSTHDPLVVTQPDPVVVTAPDPVVVQPNTPIIAPTDGFEVVQ